MITREHAARVRRLYKLVLRIHRGLSNELQVLGDSYARDEFKRHKGCNEHEAQIFMNEWADYAINLAKQMKPAQQTKKNAQIGKYLDPKMLDYMSDEQIAQLYELHKAAMKEIDEGDSFNQSQRNTPNSSA